MVLWLDLKGVYSTAFNLNFPLVYPNWGIVNRRMLQFCMFRMHGVTRRKLQTPGNAEEHKRQETPTINPIGPTDKPHRPSTKHYRKDSPGDA